MAHKLIKLLLLRNFCLFSANLLFYGMNALELISFLALAMHWPELMRRWQIVESLPVFRNCSYKISYMRQIRFISLLAMFLALSISL